MGPKRILIADDELDARKNLAVLLAGAGYEVAETDRGEEALAQIAGWSPDVVVADVSLAGLDGIGLVQRARAQGFGCSFLLTARSVSLESTVEAIQLGAENVLVKPLDPQAMLAAVARALDERRLRREAANLRERALQRRRIDGIIGDAPELKAVFDVVLRAAPTDATVLILGESGTGKELIAQALHDGSPRRLEPFIKVSCAALSETLLESELFGHERGSFTGASGRTHGRFELADGGTLFLDEIGDIAPSTQVKLLRALQTCAFERVGGTETLQVDVRLVAATNCDLAAKVKDGTFREDLYYRLNVVAVTLPPLRRRKSDIPALANFFLQRSARAYDKAIRGLAPGTLSLLLSHDWPGNVRELENAMERAVVVCKGGELTADDLPPALRGPRPARRDPATLIPGARMDEIEREAILRSIDAAGGSTSRAAKMLGISVRKVQYRLKEYGQARPAPGARQQQAPPAEAPPGEPPPSQSPPSQSPPSQ